MKNISNEELKKEIELLKLEVNALNAKVTTILSENKSNISIPKNGIELNNTIADFNKDNISKFSQKCNEIKIEVDSNTLAKAMINTIKTGKVGK